MLLEVTSLTEVSSALEVEFPSRLEVDTGLLQVYSQDFDHPKFQRGFLPCLALIKHLLENDGLALCAAAATCRLVWWSCFCPFTASVDTLRVLENSGEGKKGYRIQLLVIIISQIIEPGLLDIA